MYQSSSTSPASRAAAVLAQSHGAGSAGEAADRAEERFANIDFGGFGFWKSVERLIRQQRTAR